MYKRIWISGFLALGIGVVPVWAGFWDFLLGHHDIEVISVTDMTAAGRQLEPATPDSPVYYLSYDLGFRDLGGVMGGEKIPPTEAAQKIITRALALRGYLPANETTPPPTLFLVMTWGTLNTDLSYGPNPDAPPRQLNRQQILKFLGGYKLGFSDADFDPIMPSLTGLTLMGGDARDFYELASLDHYISVVAAYDLESIKAKQRKLLWMTRISCPSLGFTLGDVMPTMLAIGSVNFGRESTRPTWVNASDRYKAEVRLGDLKFLESGVEPGKEAAGTPSPPPAAGK